MITDEMLAQAAQQAAAQINAALPRPEECAHAFSPRFLRRMNRLLRREERSIPYRIVRAAAILLLLLTVLFGTVLTFSAQARDFIFGWVRAKTSDGYLYAFDGEASEAPMPTYTLGWLPEGYELYDAYQLERTMFYTYVEPGGKPVYFDYATEDTGFEMFLAQCDDYEQREITINGNPGTVYISPREKESSAIVWIDNSNGTIFFLSARESYDTIIEMAERVELERK